MSNQIRVREETSVGEQLRAVRGADDLVERMRAGSIAGKSDRIAAALRESDWKHGPAELHSVFGPVKFALATTEDGRTLQVQVEERNEEIVLGRAQVLNVRAPVIDVAEELIQTASAAAGAILDEDYETASPMISTVARALDLGGDLKRRVDQELDLLTIKRDCWYDSVVSENYEAEVSVPLLTIDEDNANTSLQAGIDQLMEALTKELKAAASSLAEVKSAEVEAVVLDAAQSVVEGMRHALRALGSVDRDSEREMRKVYEGVADQAERLVKGTRFVVHLVRELGQEGDLQ